MLRTSLILLGYFLAVFAGGNFVQASFRYLLQPEDKTAIQSYREKGLADGGKVIGWLERFLVLSFLLGGDYAAIGLVLAAKAILRYNDIKNAQDQKIAEYVLIGTMLSLSWAVLVGSVLIWALY